MRVSFLVLLALMLAAFAVALVLRRFFAGRAQVTEPSCGKCGYCVRGLTTMICPECGSDLREVGIVTANTARPLSPKMRLFIWSLIIPLPALVIGGMVASTIGPWQTISTQRRVIFSHVATANEIFTVVRDGQKLRWGPLNRSAPVPFESMTISMQPGTQVPALNVKLPEQTYQFADASGAAVTGNFDVTAVEQWLNSNGYTGPAVTQLAKDVHAAIAEMDTPAGSGFSSFSPDPQRGNLASVQAHPANTFTRPDASWSMFVIAAVLILLWLAGVPFALGRRGATKHRDSAATPTPAPFSA